MLKTAAYCRVSTDKSDQANSFEAQQRYFREYIERRKDMMLYDVYADEGVSGTSTRRREAFNRMINDAQNGCFERILTKEVSRFSRNILDTVSYVRDLKAIGVTVLFMNDGIDSSDCDYELRLSIMGSIAQEESRKTSQRVKWGQTRSMEKGTVFGRSMLGYRVDRGVITIEPKGAALVKRIYDMYSSGDYSSYEIAEILSREGIATYSGNSKWSAQQIIKILNNEKYAGDLIQKKTYTPDYLSHSKKYNHGQEEKIVILNHHEPIISRDQWDLVQQVMLSKRRNKT